MKKHCFLPRPSVKVANEMHIAQPDKVATKLRYDALLRYESPGMKLCSGEEDVGDWRWS